MYRETMSHRPSDPEILELVRRHNHDPEAILEIFNGLQAERGGLTRDLVLDVARALDIPPERAQGVASFYSLLRTERDGRDPLRICDGPPCWLKGSRDLLSQAQGALGENWRVERTSCLGLCDRAPAALAGWEACGPLSQANLDDIPAGWRGEEKTYRRPLPGEERILLAHVEELDPDSIESALEHGAYQGLEKALQMEPIQVIEEVEQAGVRGRGGAGFPAGRKWRFVAGEERRPKYIVCNADESEPLVFKDRVLIDTNPHQVLEGMILAGYAVGAEEGFIYIRGEYASQADRLERAIQQAKEGGYLGKGILGTAFRFQVHLHRGAGAYICGEETALLESLEGRRGEPRVRPPFPTVSGYRGLPTVVNNVETFAMIPQVIRNGASWYRSVGHPDQPGTKLYTLLGDLNQPGLFEARFGLTIDEIIETFGGGMRPGTEPGLALTGGAAGTMVPPGLFGVPLHYDSQDEGVSLGAGAILVVDKDISPVSLLRELLFFFEVESCGKCTPCRVGTHQARTLLDRLLAGEGDADDLERLRGLADILHEGSLCGLGQFAAMPVRSAMTHFPAAFHALISA